LRCEHPEDRITTTCTGKASADRLAGDAFTALKRNPAPRQQREPPFITFLLSRTVQITFVES
jgi:hypothetical protein